MMSRILGPKRNEVSGGRRKLHSEQLHNFSCSRSIDRMIRSRKVMWAGHVARMGRREMPIGFWWEKRKEGERLENQDVDDWIILMWLLVVWSGLIWVRLGTSGGFL
jgi:hypothetical protein